MVPRNSCVFHMDHRLRPSLLTQPPKSFAFDATTKVYCEIVNDVDYTHGSGRSSYGIHIGRYIRR